MSLIPPGIAASLASALNLVSPALFLQRNIGGFVADVTIEEVHIDRLTKTRQPVEQGAAVTDHAYVEPSQVLIRAGWSNSSVEADGDPNYVTDTYNDFLALQQSRQPFDILTGKRSYSDMLITRLQARTDEKSENALMLEVECEQNIFVSTQTVQVPDANQATPQVTGNTNVIGRVMVRPATTFNSSAAGGDAP